MEASTDAVVTNDNTERTRSCIALGPVGNRQGSVKCFDIETGKILHRRTVTHPVRVRVSTIDSCDESRSGERRGLQ